MKHALFVDDEPHILRGLQRMLRTLRDEWDTSFAAGGFQALDMLANAAVPFDVVVSDMRMPGMSGAELLMRVRELQPNAVRIILSGQSEGQASRQAAVIAHRFLSKPCDPTNLINVVSEACAARDLLPAHLQGAAAAIGILPVASQHLEHWGAALTDADSARAGQIAAQDAALSAKLLQLVNSAFLGTPRPLCDPAEAVRHLGTETLLSLMPQLFVPLPDAPPAADLRDVGRLLLAAYAPERYAPLQAMPDSTALCLAEQAEFGADHAAVGASLLGLWGLPAELRESVASHHFPCDCPASEENTHV